MTQQPTTNVALTRGIAIARKDAAALRRANLDRERARIARLSDNDTVRIMARVIAQAAHRRGEVDRRDFRQAGIPDARIDANFDAAMSRARRIDSAIDGMGALP
jgi:hypothetical protein